MPTDQRLSVPIPPPRFPLSQPSPARGEGAKPLLHIEVSTAIGTTYGTIFALSFSRSSHVSIHAQEKMAMQHRNTVLRKYSLLTFLGLSLLALAVPWLAHAGGVHVSVGLELPVLVAGRPAPGPR